MKNRIISLLLNILIFLSVAIGELALLGSWFAYPYINFVPDWTDFLKDPGFLLIAYSGIVSLVGLIALLILKKDKALNRFISTLKMTSAVASLLALFEFLLVDSLLLAPTLEAGEAFRAFMVSYQGGLLVCLIAPVLNVMDYAAFCPKKDVNVRDASYALIPVAVAFVISFVYPSVLSAAGSENMIPSYFVFKLFNTKEYGVSSAILYMFSSLVIAEIFALALCSKGEEVVLETAPIEQKKGEEEKPEEITNEENQGNENQEVDEPSKVEDASEEIEEEPMTIKEKGPVEVIEPEQKELQPLLNDSPEEVLPPSNETKAKGKYEVYPEAGMFKYRLKANNGEILLVSNDYKTREGAKKGIETLKKNLKEGTHRIVTDKNGYSQFRIFTSKDSRLVASGEIYRTLLSAQNALASTQRFGNSRKIVDLDEIPESEIREEAVTLPEVERKQNGKVELYIDESDKKWRTRLIANNGEILFTSAAYSSKSAALNGLNSIKAKASSNSFHIYRDKQNRYQYMLLSDNGLVLLLGETYNSRERAISSATSVRSFLANSVIVDLVAQQKESLKKEMASKENIDNQKENAQDGQSQSN